MPTGELSRATDLRKKIEGKIKSIKPNEAESVVKTDVLEAAKAYLDAGTALENFIEENRVQAIAERQYEEKKTEKADVKSLQTQAVAEPDAEFVRHLRMIKTNFEMTKTILDEKLKLINLENHKATRELVAEVIDINKHIALNYGLGCPQFSFTKKALILLGIFNRKETNKEQILENKLREILVPLEDKAETEKSKPQIAVLRKAIYMLDQHDFTKENLDQLKALLGKYRPMARGAAISEYVSFSPTVNLITDLISHVEQNLPLSQLQLK